MYTTNIIQDEQDILIVTYSRAATLINDMENAIKDSNLSKADKENLISNTKNEINNILNVAFNNKKFYNYLDTKQITTSLPENYFKPDKEYMDLLKIAYEMNDKQFNELLKDAEAIANKKEIQLIPTMELTANLYKETNKKLEDLESKKDTLTRREYKKTKKLILKQDAKKVKEIEKKYPFKKELQKFLNEEE